MEQAHCLLLAWNLLTMIPDSFSYLFFVTVSHRNMLDWNSHLLGSMNIFFLYFYEN